MRNIHPWLFALLCLSVCITGCSFGLTYIGATQQRWAGGVKGSPSGIHYRVEVKKVAKAEVKLGEAWVPEEGSQKGYLLRTFGEAEDPELGTVTNYGNMVPEGIVKFVVGFDLVYTYSEDEGQQAQSEPRPDWVPKDFEGAALIRYTYAGRETTTAIPEFEILEPLNHP